MFYGPTIGKGGASTVSVVCGQNPNPLGCPFYWTFKEYGPTLGQLALPPLIPQSL